MCVRASLCLRAFRACVCFPPYIFFFPTRRRKYPFARMPNKHYKTATKMFYIYSSATLPTQVNAKKGSTAKRKENEYGNCSVEKCHHPLTTPMMVFLSNAIRTMRTRRLRLFVRYILDIKEHVFLCAGGTRIHSRILKGFQLSHSLSPSRSILRTHSIEGNALVASLITYQRRFLVSGK